MCGIVGLVRTGGLADEASAHDLMTRMSDRLRHRGPDDSGSWVDPAGAALGFRRLSIIDLSPAGHQPMLSADGRYAVVMNGEIYNFPDLRQAVEQARGGVAWRGHSDTEVLVEAIAQWGVEAALRRANGMFALGVWDREERVLVLARDRIGKKPLYYGWAGEDFLFGSELKALWPHPRFDFTIAPAALGDFLQLGYVPGERTIFSAIRKLPGGTLLRLGPSAGRGTAPRPEPYWSLRDVAAAGLEAQASGAVPEEAELEALLRDAVARRMVADVPVGAFLSGGVDSSLVTAMMAGSAAEPVRSFSIGFAVPEWNEAEHAKGVAAHIGTRHKELYVTPADLVAVVEDLPGILDEPFADDSMIPTTLLCRMARQEVTVALSGDGGDELFAGYARYAAIDRWLARREALPATGRALASRLAQGLAGPAGRLAGVRMQRRFLLLGSLLRHGDADRVHEMLVSQTLRPGALLLADDGGGGHPLTGGAFNLGRSGPIDRMTFTDTASYLTDDILAKVDRASMSTSLEVRCPLLDYRVIELSWRFPAAVKCSNGTGKQPLRNILYRHVPRALVDRPKMGFGAPVEVWLTRELRDWAEALMSRDALARHGLLDVESCRALWDGFVRHGRGWDRVIWNILMFQAWHQSMSALWAEPVAA